MLIEDFQLLQKLLAALLIGYLLGSVPFAHLAARLKGVDIFSTGNRRAGTANVFWNVSRRTGVMVFAGDVAKGALAVFIAGLMDLPGPLVILAGGGAVLGHWKSIFTGFKGGDGMATLLGVTVVVTPLLGLLAIGIGVLAVAASWKSPYRSAVGVAVCFAVILVLGPLMSYPLQQTLALTALGALVITHNVVVRRRIAADGIFPPDELDDLELDLDLASEDGPDPDLEPSPPNSP